jgi:peptide/nickel transport system permease protein
MNTTTSVPISTPVPKNRSALRFVRLNPLLSIGLFITILLAFFAYIGPMLVEASDANVGAFSPRIKPSAEHWLGTDTQGRDIFAVLTLATPQTLNIGLMAGALGVFVGTVLGLLSGYFSGIIDTIIRILTDVLITIPAIAILVVVATNVRIITVGLMAVIIAALAWRLPARAIRAQTLSVRERGYVEVARLNGMGDLELIVKEVLPNLLPYIAASFVSTVSWSILATIGLEALGLGPQNELTLGMMIYWSQYYGAILRGFYWWWAPPIIVIVLIFVGLFFTSAGLDQMVNTRLRRAV